MKSRILMLAMIAGLSFSASGQGLVGKLKQKAEQAAEKAAQKKAAEEIGIEDDEPSNSGTNPSQNSSNRPTNKGGGGLITTPPDVNQNLSDAEAAFKSASYGEARYAVQQAMFEKQQRLAA